MPGPFSAVTHRSGVWKSEPTPENRLVSAKHAVGETKQISPRMHPGRRHTRYRSPKKWLNVSRAPRLFFLGSGIKNSSTVGAITVSPSNPAASGAAIVRTSTTASVAKTPAAPRFATLLIPPTCE